MQPMDLMLDLFGLAALLVVVALIACGAYRVGHANGITAERARREGLEARIEQRIAAAAREDAALWETGMDV